jgi:galactose mutarotase-like enzyme
MVEGAQTGEVSLLDRQKNPYVTVCFDTPLFAVWSPEGKNAPFVCIEPWYGRCDAQGFTGSLEERDYEQVLAPGAEFAAEYRMIFAASAE